MTTKALIAVAATIILVGGLGGCSTVASSETEGAPAVSAPPAPAPTASDESEPVDAETASQPGAYTDYFDGAIAETAGTKVLFFHAPWCPKCRALEEDILAQQLPDDLTIFKVDFDTATDLRQTYGVTLQTTIVYVDDNGSELSKSVLSSDTSLAALLAAAP